MADFIRAWLTRLYPPSWRERYAVEFDLLLEECLHSPLDVLDVILGAVDAHWQILNGVNVNWRLMNMLNKLRTTILIVFTAYIGFVIAGMALVGLVDDSPMIPLMHSNPAPALAWTIIQTAALVAVLAIIVGGLPVAITIIRSVFSGDRRSLGLLLVPMLAFLILLLYVGFLFAATTGVIHIEGVVQSVQPDNFPLGNRLLLLGLMLVFIFGALASVLAIWKAVSITDVDRQSFQAGGKTLNIEIYRFAYVPAVIVAFSMLVMLVATLVWGWMVFSSLPQVFFGDFGLLLTSTQVWFYGILAVMAMCCLVAFFGLTRGRSALKPA